ncbi:MAG: DUF4115 domain-containing protein, partial [Rhodospirillaceae bacterium]|nr:DUF4115 domain-containing protein [Rhodospirillaceae bacterium]
VEIKEASATLRIRAVYLEALEDGRFSDLPGSTYVAGFLRTYGDFLDLDGEELVRRFKDETGGVLVHQQLSFPVPASEARRPTGAIIVGALVLAIAGAAIWYVVSERKLVDLDLVTDVPETVTTTEDSAIVVEPAVPETVAEPEASAVADVETTADDAAPAAQPDEPADIADEAAVPDDAQPVEENAATIEEAASDALDSGTEDAAAAGVETGGVPASGSEVAGDDDFVETEALLNSDSGYVPRVYGRTNTNSRVEVRALAETWIQVEGPSNVILLTRVLLPGDVYRVPNRADVTLDTGNAGGLEIRVDGDLIAPLGEQGIVVRNVPLGVDQLLSR